MKIYTKTGDAGETSLFDGTRVRKTDPRVVAYGEVDELQACIGAARAAGLDPDLTEMCLTMQRDLFAVGARLADPSHKIAARVEKAVIGEDDVTRLEEWIDRLEAEMPALRHFILSGGTLPAASLQVARAVCRRAERAALAIGGGEVEPVVLTYLNRVSDLLFMMARATNHRTGLPETEW
ncbi:MAG: cob(I)yrinic acid a,c-diamide adenosyltransferase [Acidobacteria bacterium]|nr:cob(I)yrinic acid a,c-diamide adenosyltransferase [Acidobacteriota bacterium]